MTTLLTLILYLGEKGTVTWSPGIIIIVAAVLRCLFLFRPPELSDDIFRYLWDGMQLLNGHNPYTSAPADVQPITEEAARLLQKINHPDIVTIYPPMAQLVFSVGAFFGKGLFGIKALLVIMDIVTCVLLLRLLKILEMPPSRAALYAWHPLPVLEIAASGHIDGAGILFFVMVLILLTAQIIKHHGIVLSIKQNLKSAAHRHAEGIISVSAGIVFSGASLVKLFPLLYLPGCLLLVRCRALFILGLLTGGLFLMIPFYPDLLNIRGTFYTYLTSWEFSSFAYRSLQKITSSGEIARWLLALIFLVVFSFLTVQLWMKRGTFKDEREKIISVLQYFYFISLTFLMFTPTLYPWYVLCLAWLLPFSAGPAGLVLSWAVFISYWVLIPYTFLGQWVENDMVPLMIFLSPISAFLIASIVKHLRQNHFI